MTTSLKLGANISDDFMYYPKDMISTFNYNIPYIRFRGGTVSRTARHNENNPYFTPDIAKRDAVFSKYKHFNYMNSFTWTWLKTVTNDLTKDYECPVTLPMGCFYQTSEGLRQELLSKYEIIAKIGTYGDLLKSNLIQRFITEVTDKLDMIRALQDNRVKILTIEILNEAYTIPIWPLNIENNDFRGNYDGWVWTRNKTIRTGSTISDYELSMRVYTSLAKMFVALIKEISPTMEFILPLAEDLSVSSGFALWNNYLLKQSTRDFIGVGNRYAQHLYAHVDFTGIQTI